MVISSTWATIIMGVGCTGSVVKSLFSYSVEVYQPLSVLQAHCWPAPSLQSNCITWTALTKVINPSHSRGHHLMQQISIIKTNKQLSFLYPLQQKEGVVIQSRLQANSLNTCNMPVYPSLILFPSSALFGFPAIVS